MASSSNLPPNANDALARLHDLKQRFFSKGGDFALKCTLGDKVVYEKKISSKILERIELFKLMINSDVGGAGRKLDGSIDISQWYPSDFDDGNVEIFINTALAGVFSAAVDVENDACKKDADFMIALHDFRQYLGLSGAGIVNYLTACIGHANFGQMLLRCFPYDEFHYDKYFRSPALVVDDEGKLRSRYAPCYLGDEVKLLDEHGDIIGSGSIHAFLDGKDVVIWLGEHPDSKSPLSGTSCDKDKIALSDRSQIEHPRRPYVSCKYCTINKYHIKRADTNEIVVLERHQFSKKGDAEFFHVGKALENAFRCCDKKLDFETQMGDVIALVQRLERDFGKERGCCKIVLGY